MGTRANGCTTSSQPAPPAAPAAETVDKDVDFANYFCTYGFLFHQKEMLSDRARMDAYFHSISRNKHHFKDKVVLDVGTGSGILAIWCAQAGAKKVYAVEATKMADHARELVKGNSVENIVEVIEGSMEEVNLPEKVDVIISEWMGYFLLRESMFDSVICARDRFLKPDGMMYPSHARMWIAPIRSGLLDQKSNDLDCSMDDWQNFTEETETHYGVNMSVLTKAYCEEHEKYYFKTSLWCNLDPNQVVGEPALIKEIDCLKATVEEIRTVVAKVTTLITMDRSRVSAFAGWFDVQFKGNEGNPAKNEIELTTAPDNNGGTHWGQQVFLVRNPFRVDQGDKLNVSFKMSRAKQYHRLMDVELISELELSSGKRLPPVTTRVAIE